MVFKTTGTGNEFQVSVAYGPRVPDPGTTVEDEHGTPRIRGGYQVDAIETITYVDKGYFVGSRNRHAPAVEASVSSRVDEYTRGGRTSRWTGVERVTLPAVAPGVYSSPVRVPLHASTLDDRYQVVAAAKVAFRGAIPGEGPHTTHRIDSNYEREYTAEGPDLDSEIAGVP